MGQPVVPAAVVCFYEAHRFTSTKWEELSPAVQWQWCQDWLNHTYGPEQGTAAYPATGARLESGPAYVPLDEAEPRDVVEFYEQVRYTGRAWEDLPRGVQNSWHRAWENITGASAPPRVQHLTAYTGDTFDTRSYSCDRDPHPAEVPCPRCQSDSPIQLIERAAGLLTETLRLLSQPSPSQRSTDYCDDPANGDA